MLAEIHDPFNKLYEWLGAREPVYVRAHVIKWIRRELADLPLLYLALGVAILDDVVSPPHVLPVAVFVPDTTVSVVFFFTEQPRRITLLEVSSP